MSKLNEHENNIITDEIKSHIAAVIKETVNGKIDRQREEMQAFLKSFYEASRSQVAVAKRLEEKLDKYIEDDNDWKETAQPIITMGHDARTSIKVFLYIAGLITAFAGATAIILNLFKNK